jgi:hypothetical protein
VVYNRLLIAKKAEFDKAKKANYEKQKLDAATANAKGDAGYHQQHAWYFDPKINAIGKEVGKLEGQIELLRLKFINDLKRRYP